MSFHNKTANLRGGYVSIEWQEDEIIMSPSIPRDFSRSLVSMHRSLDEVERVGTLDCRLMTSMKTDYGGFAKAKGTMFSLTVKERLDLLSMEFDIAEGISGGDVAMEVYYRKGEFSGYTNDQQQWTKLADTIFYLAPDGKGAIIPTNEFTTVTMEPGQKYSIYLSFQSDVLKLKTSKQLIGELYQSTDILDLYVGVTLDDGPFPNTFGIASDFAGVLHYRTLLPCSRVLMTTSVPMEFAINENPDPDTLNELADAVKKAITALITLNPTLIRYEKFHELELQDVASGFQGRSEEKCPTDYSTCSLVTCTIHFGHLQTIDSGVLQQEILSSEDRISDSVMTQSDFEVEYVGAPIIEGEFLITLKGVPSGGLIMNPLQKRYFEKVTSEFFNKFSKVPVYHVEVTNEVPEGGVNGVDGEQEILEGAKEQESERRLHRQLGRSSTTMDFHTNASGRQLQNHIYLRRSNNSRNLQEGETQVVTKFYGAGTDSDLRNGIFEVAITNEEQFLKELSLQQLRPGEINKEDSGSHFANLVGIVVGPVPADFNKPGTVAGGITDTENQYQLYMYICYGGMAFSALWLVYRFYKDCCYSSKPGMESIPKHDPKEGVRSRFRPGLSFKRNNNRPGRPTDSDKTSPPPPVPQRRPSFDKFLPEEKFQQANYWSGLFGKKKDDDGIVDDNRSMENSKGASKTRGGCVPKTPIQRSKSFDGVFGKKKGDEPKPVDNSKTTFSSTGKKLVKDDEKRAPATNKAGQNGRGVLPSRSLPTFLRPSNPDIKQLKPSTTKAKKTANDKSLSSNQAGIKTKKNVGSNEKKKGNPAKNGSGKKGAGKKKKVGAASGKKRAKNPSAKNPANAKNLPDFNKEAKEKKISRKNNVGGSPKSNLVEKKERLAENGKLENSLVKKDEDAKNGKANPKRSPKNQAGQKRGIQKSKSLPMEKKLAVARDWSSSEEDLSSNESESSDNSPKNVLANKKKQVKTKTETHAEDWSSSESSGDESGFSNEETDAPESSKDDSSSEESSGVADSDSESNSESEPSAETSNLADGETDCSEGEDGTITNTPRSKQSLSSKKRGNETEGRSIASKNPQFSKKSPASNQRGRRVRGVDASKSMPVMKRAPSRPSFYDSYSSEESDFEEKADPNWGSMASIEPEDLPKKHGQYNASYQEIDKGLVGRAAKKKIAPKKHAPYSSSDEEIDQGYGAKKKTAPKKHVPYSSSDEEIEKGYGAKKRIRPKKHHSFSKSLSDDEMTKSKFIYPNKHLPRSLSDDESSAKKEPVTKSQSGTKRGVSASKSTPFQHKYPVQKNLVAPKRILPQKHRSFNKSLSDDEITEPKFIHPNKHFPRSLSDDESPAKKGPVAKNQSGMRGRGVSASKSMPFQQKHPVKETTAYGNTKNNLVAPKRIPPNRSKSSEFEKKQPPKRTNSKEFGKFGKIKFQPRK